MLAAISKGKAPDPVARTNLGVGRYYPEPLTPMCKGNRFHYGVRQGMQSNMNWILKNGIFCLSIPSPQLSRETGGVGAASEPS